MINPQQNPTFSAGSGGRESQSLGPPILQAYDRDPSYIKAIKTLHTMSITKLGDSRTILVIT